MIGSVQVPLFVKYIKSTIVSVYSPHRSAYSTDYLPLEIAAAPGTRSYTGLSNIKNLIRHHGVHNNDKVLISAVESDGRHYFY